MDKEDDGEKDAGTIDRIRERVEPITERVKALPPVAALVRLLDGGGLDSAATLAYYSFFSFFPMALAVASVFNLVGFGERVVSAIIEFVSETFPQDIVGLIETPLHNVGDFSGFALVVSIVLLLWTASNYVAAFGRNVDRLEGLESDRPAILKRPRMFLVTLGFLVLLITVSAVLVLTSNVMVWVAQTFDFDTPTFFTILEAFRWPIVIALGMGAIALLYFAAPGELSLKSKRLRRKQGTERFFPGAAAAMGIIAAITLGLSLYLSEFGRYEIVYGALASIIILLLWFWLLNIGLLYGYELNSVLEEKHAPKFAADELEGIIEEEERD